VQVAVDFRPSADWTIGLEWELGLVDPGSGDLRPLAKDVLAAVRVEGADPFRRVTGELLTNTVELVTGVCRSVPEAMADLAASLAVVHDVTDRLGVELFCAGCHPFARWDDQVVSPGERYATLIDRTQWWGRQMLIYGVHVHVGIPHRDRVLPVLNAMLCYQPHLQALSASSPFWAGADTGYASNRALLFQQLPTAGLPFQFDTWAEYEAFVGDMVATGVIDDLSELRWDLRPSPRLGTLEIRVCDGVPTLSEVGALAALTHCLVVDLAQRLAAGEQLPRLAPWHVQENKWRAARYGLDAIVIVDAGSRGQAGGPVRERLVTDDLRELLDRLAPVATRLGCADELSTVREILRHGASYQRQRAVAAAAGGDLTTVVKSLIGQLRSGI
jgi:carboxylate-amine ligase